MPNGPKKEGIVFDKTKRLALYGHEWRPHLTNFLTFFPNLVELEIEAKECWSPADARCISNFASLQRLIINEVNSHIKREEKNEALSKFLSTGTWNFGIFHGILRRTEGTGVDNQYPK